MTSLKTTHIHIAILCGSVSVASVNAASDTTGGAATSPASAAPVEESPGGKSSVDALSSRATDPTASLMAFNFQGIYSTFHGPDVPGERDERWELQFRPVIPFEFLDHPNLLRLTIPYQIGGRGDEGWEPISVFDLFMFNEKWGRWGVGPVMSLDTTGDAPDRFVIGPAIGGVWRVICSSPTTGNPNAG
jgi:hypothetical protein